MGYCELQVVRAQRLTRVVQRVWLKPVSVDGMNVSAPSDNCNSKLAQTGDQDSSQTGAPFVLGQTVMLSLPSGSASEPPIRSYTISQVKPSKDQQTWQFALDIVVHDDMAKYGITGLRSTAPQFMPAEDAPGTGNPMAAGGNPMAAENPTADNPMMANDSLNPMMASSELLPPTAPAPVPPAEQVKAGPGATWAANARVGDRLWGLISPLESPILVCQNELNFTWNQSANVALLVDLSAFPAAQAITQAYGDSTSAPSFTVIGKVQHKADRQVFPAAEKTDFLRPKHEPTTFLRDLITPLTDQGLQVWVAGGEEWLQTTKAALKNLPKTVEISEIRLWS
ncbi:hypothetical protein BK816_07840 [Boudabousia tangfeifanii]|uniref:FAD-binding FR-type domain-containing protein n=1 Tax=Boudabousia tangfeifanii TaxID=1912795 RepID=A0A1D9MM21_9ACTO|nr:siderophore-interacting protein [Boudabousia tangfeifanii]AOZ73213.1 hypothetical protein BK816_07840 [Boudabousia tangfeifanii]